MNGIFSEFKKYPSQEQVVKLMLKNGISVKNSVAHSGNIKISDSALGRAAGADRRVARSAIDKIVADPSLLSFFSKLKPTPLFDEVASEMGCTTLEIIPIDARMPGILSDVSAVIFHAGISVRQAVVDDPEFNKDAHLLLVIEGNIPPEHIPMIQRCNGVKSIILR